MQRNETSLSNDKLYEEIKSIAGTDYPEDKSISKTAKNTRSPQDILNLFKKSQEHAAAYEASRKKSWGLESIGGGAGVTSATFGTLLYTGVLAMSVMPVTGVAIGCVASVCLFASGVKSLDSKQGQLAAHEANLVTNLLQDLLDQKNYKDFTRSVLLIIKEVAMQRSTNADRDVFLSTVITQIADNDVGIFEIAKKLVNLRHNLLIKNSTSVTAGKIEDLIRKLEKKMLEQGLYKEVVKINVALIESDISRRKTTNRYRDQLLTHFSQDIDYATTAEDVTKLVIVAKNNLFINSKTSQAASALERLQGKLEEKFGKVSLEEQQYQTPGMSGSIQ